MRLRVGLWLSLTAALLLAPAAGRGQERSDLAEEGIVVVGKEEPEDLFECDRSVSEIGPERLRETTPRTIPEALGELPGVWIQQTNPGGGSPIIRGFVGPQNLMLVDGVRYNNSIYRTGPTQYLNLVGPLSIESLEVLRGPGSVSHGSDALGGVVALRPLRAPDARLDDGVVWGLHSLLRAGLADGQRTGHVDGSFGVGGFGARAAVSYRQFDDLDGGGDIGAQPHTSYRHWSALGSFAYRWPAGGALDGWRLSVTWLLNRLLDAGRADKWESARKAQRYDNYDDLVYARLRTRIRPMKSTLAVTASYRRFFERADDFKYDDDRRTLSSAVRDESTAHTLGLDLRATTSLLERRLQIHWGGMWYRDWVSSERWTRAGYEAHVPAGTSAFPDGSTYDVYGLFALLEGDPLRSDQGHTLRLSAGYRLSGMAGYAPGRETLPSVDWSDLGHVAHASVRYLWDEKITVGLSFSQGFRGPNLFEAVVLGGTTNYFNTPNENLGAERSDTLELLTRLSLGPVSAEAVGFLSFIHDLIRREETTWEGQSVVRDQDVVKHINVGEALLWGVEARLGVDVGMGLSLFGSLSWIWGEEEVSGGPDVPLSRIPPLFGHGGVRWEHRAPGQWGVFVESYVRAAAKQDRLSPGDIKDVRIPEGGTPGWWTWNARAGVWLPNAFRITLSAENLLDEKYRVHASGFWASGVHVLATLETTL